MDAFLAALFIFLLRVTDVSIGTIRTLFTVRGRKYVSASLAFFEAGVFIVALSRVMKDLGTPSKMLAYALGFAAGNFCGITIERWIGSGTILARIVARNTLLLLALREQGFGVTLVQGEGWEGDVLILFVVAPRRREKELLKLVEQLEPAAFVTLDTVDHALGGYLSSARRMMGVRK